MAAHLITAISRYLVDVIGDAPTVDVPIGSRAYNLDDSLWYIFDGTTWSELTAETVLGLSAEQLGDLFGSVPVADALDGSEIATLLQGGDLKRTTAQDIADLGGGSADLSAIAEDVLPDADDTYDLGSQAKRWADIYLSGAIKGVVPDYSAGSGQVAGDQKLIGLVTYPGAFESGNPYAAIRIGDRDGSVGGQIIFDPYGTNGIFIENALVAMSAAFDPDDPFGTDYAQLRSDGLQVLSATQAAVFQTGGGSLTAKLHALPTTTDPAADGQLFTCTAAELAGLLGAGAKHVLVSKGAT